jgi:arylsulfatase A
VLRVPLVIRDPASDCAPRVVKEPVSLVSLTPTVLELLGIDAPGLTFQGPSLAETLRCTGSPPPAPIYAEVSYLPLGMDRPVKRARMKAIVEGDFKLILDQQHRSTHLYDLSRDPAETSDLAAERPELTSRLEETLRSQARRSKQVAHEPRLWQPQTSDLERLRALGYVR